MKVEFDSALAAAAPPACEDAIAEACRRIAPLWPLSDFVAVNPFLGFADQSFSATAATFRRVARIDMLMPRAFYAKAIEDGVISDADLDAAAGANLHAAALKAAARRAPAPLGAIPGHVATVAEILDALAGDDRLASHTAFMIDEISRFFADYFDEGQALWPLAGQGRSLYGAWRLAMRHDRNAAALGLGEVAAVAAAASPDPRRAIADAVAALGLPAPCVADYLHRALLDLGGWASYGRQLGWGAELEGGTDDTLVEMLAVRLVWGYGLFCERRDPEFAAAWAAALARAAARPAASTPDAELAIDLRLHEAYERARQRRWIARLAEPRAPAPKMRPQAQAVFCIDVRSEVFRRALESVAPDIETLGFAGFFGFAFDYRPFGASASRAQAPVLVKPKTIVCEAVDGEDGPATRRALGRQERRERLAKAWKAFKLSAVSSFGFVETAGLAYLPRLAAQALGLPQPTPRKPTRLKPDLSPVAEDGTGLTLAVRVATAEAVLRSLSLTQGLAPLVLLVGHGATSANNPFAASLHCGACGGHTGEANSRVAAAALNDPEVRRALVERGLAIPNDTLFVAALHDTTTDEARLFDVEAPPASHVGALASIEAALKQAGALARAERAGALGVKREQANRALARRARDWSQVRPEWGLAGATAFIAAPRRLTAGLDLGGRAFLNSYDWRTDEGFRTLDQILSAPLVVASWINLGYFGATVNNAAFGAGDKTLHNVVGGFGVIEGAGGPLRGGLPWQSVHDGRAFVHEPVRLSAFVAAPRAAIEASLARCDGVRPLIENGWIHLFQLDDDGRGAARYRPQAGWQALL